MTGAAHTLGPWRISSESAHMVTGGNALLVADCRNGSVHPAIEERCAANARLIAAAPELLAELKSALCYIDTYGGEVTSSFAAGGNRARVSLIVAKAEGGAE